MNFSNLRSYDSQTIEVRFLPLFVSYCQKFKIKGRWMSHIGTKFGPLVGGRIAVGKVDEIYAVVDKLL